MADPLQPLPTATSEVDEFLAELDRKRNQWKDRSQRIGDTVRLSFRLNVADQFAAALPRPRSRPDSVNPDTVADSILEFVARCRSFEVTDNLERAGQDSGSDKREVHARALYRAAIAEDRQTLISRIEELRRCPQDVQDDTWSLVGELARQIVRPARRVPGKPMIAPSANLLTTALTSDQELALLDKETLATPFIPTSFQRRLLAALDGKALTADNLQDVLDVDRKQLYRDGINPLKTRGLIQNNRRVGYYRPDKLPSWLAEWLAARKLNGN